MKLGERSEPVKGLQRGMAAAGLYRGPIDGWYGASTALAVSSWREELGMDHSLEWTPDVTRASLARFAAMGVIGGG